MATLRRIASCSCGQLTVTAAGDPLRISVCHCLACQRRTGSVFSEQARYPAAAVTAQGESSLHVRTADSGHATTYSFCPQCGSTVHYRSDSEPLVVAIPVGAFADPSFLAPAASFYERRKHAWVQMPRDMTHED